MIMLDCNHFLDVPMMNAHCLTQDNDEPSMLSSSSLISKTTATDYSTTNTAIINDRCLSGNTIELVNHHDQSQVNIEHLGK